MNDHWLLYTSDREHGGQKILGIFNTYAEAWEHYEKTHTDFITRHYRIPFIEGWRGDKPIED